MSGEAGEKQNICMQCKHFYITWDKVHPYGCRAFGFKGRVMPALTVKGSSGMECALFRPGGKKGSSVSFHK
jgi:hypothetical protein